MSQQATSIADINQLDREGETRLMKASKYGEAAIVTDLLSKGANVHLANSTGETALILASQAGSNDIVKELLAAGSNIHHRSDAGTAIIMAAQEGHKDVLETLIKAGASVNDVSTDSNDTPLHLVLKLIRERNHLKTLVQLLVKAKANINPKNDEGETPLSLASVLRDPVKTEILSIIGKKKKGGRKTAGRRKSQRRITRRR
jgi:ankyrin repeat protein